MPGSPGCPPGTALKKEDQLSGKAEGRISCRPFLFASLIELTPVEDAIGREQARRPISSNSKRIELPSSAELIE